VFIVVVVVDFDMTQSGNFWIYTRTVSEERLVRIKYQCISLKPLVKDSYLVNS